jgi:hypothetical protein
VLAAIRNARDRRAGAPFWVCIMRAGRSPRADAGLRPRRRFCDRACASSAASGSTTQARSWPTSSQGDQGGTIARDGDYPDQTILGLCSGNSLTGRPGHREFARHSNPGDEPWPNVTIPRAPMYAFMLGDGTPELGVQNSVVHGPRSNVCSRNKPAHRHCESYANDVHDGLTRFDVTRVRLPGFISSAFKSGWRPRRSATDARLSSGFVAFHRCPHQSFRLGRRSSANGEVRPPAALQDRPYERKRALEVYFRFSPRRARLNAGRSRRQCDGPRAPRLRAEGLRSACSSGEIKLP